jgi:beta-glucosidase-like glycosyl hydrolase
MARRFWYLAALSLSPVLMGTLSAHAQQSLPRSALADPTARQPASRAVREERPQTEAQVESRVTALLGQMTLEEKIDLLAGTGFATRPLPRLNIPPFRMSDGPVGAHLPPPSTAMAAGIGLAATWDPALAERMGQQIGRDARSRGAHFLLGPGVNLYRAPMNGRNFEYFGEDPYLGAHRRGLHSGRTERTRERHHQALHGQQLRVRPQYLQYRH